MAILTQLITWLIFEPIINIFFRYRVVGRTEWQIQNLSAPAILVANHRSYMDHFFLVGFMPFFSRIWPIRFLVSKRFFSWKTGPLGVILRLGGCIPITRTIPGERGLAEVLKSAEEALARPSVMVLFPEGKRAQAEDPLPTKGGRGAAYLALKHHVPIVPCFIDGNRGLTFWNSILGKNHVTLYVGMPYLLTGNYQDENDLRLGTTRIISSIGELADAS